MKKLLGSWFWVDYEKNIIKNDTVQKKGKILCHKDTAENHVKILAQ